MARCRFKFHYQQLLTVLIVFYIVGSCLVFIKFTSHNSRMETRDLRDRLINIPNIYRDPVRDFLVDPSWKVLDPCDTNYGQFLGNKHYICKMYEDRYTDSSGNFIAYGREFALLTNVVLDPYAAKGRAGGENISLVMNQKESEEYLNLNKSYFKLNCDKLQPQAFIGQNHLNDWVSSVSCVNISKSAKVVPGFTIAVQRYEYVNLYHTMTDYYNAFLMMVLFKQLPNNTIILFVDSHPAGGLDTTWGQLFAKTYRAGSFTSQTKFPTMVWNVLSYNSPLNNHDLPYVPYLEEFRKFFLLRHNVNLSKNLNCNKLSVLIIFRRDYVAHPRNPSGVVSRKIKNEAEILNAIEDLLPGHHVRGLQLDKLSMKKQLELIADTDILLGMHGAGLSHALFLPKHAGMIEFYPTYWPQANRHFRTMCKWRNLYYLTWKNHDVSNEFPGKLTYIPTRIVVNMVKDMMGKMCKS